MSTPPSASTASAAIARAPASVLTSPVMKWASAGVSVAAERAVVTTSAPASSRRWTIAAPMPRLPPVTSARRPSRSRGVVQLSRSEGRSGCHGNQPSTVLDRSVQNIEISRLAAVQAPGAAAVPAPARLARCWRRARRPSRRAARRGCSKHLRVAVDRAHHAVDDRGQVVEAHLQHGLGVDALDVELDAAQPGVHADVEVQQVEQAGLERHASVEFGDLEIHFVDVQARDVEVDVGIATPGARAGAGLELARRPAGRAPRCARAPRVAARSPARARARQLGSGLGLGGQRSAAPAVDLARFGQGLTGADMLVAVAL